MVAQMGDGIQEGKTDGERSLSLVEFARAAGESTRTIQRQIAKGEIVPIAARRSGKRGRPGQRLPVGSLCPEGRDRWLREQLAQSGAAAASSPPALTPAPDLQADDSSPRPALYPQRVFGFAQMPGEIRALAIPEQEKPVVWKRFSLAGTIVNGNYLRQGFRLKKDFLAFVRRAEGVPESTQRRWAQLLKAAKGDPAALADKPPGPAPTGPEMDDWQKLFLDRAYFSPEHKPKYRQVFKDLERERKVRQARWGPRKHYKFVSYDQVRAYVRSRGYVMERWRAGGAKALSQSLYLDRTFEDEHSGDTWDSDECELNAFVYLARHRTVNNRPWILTIMDERSTAILGWKVVYSKKQLTADTVVDLIEATLRGQIVGHDYAFRPLNFYSDRGGHFRGRVGGSFHVEDREKLVGKAAAGLGSLGVTRKGPEEENPRGNRIERCIHQFYGLKARGLSSWCGANTRERQGTGIDEKRRRHALICAGKLDEPTALVSDEEFERIVSGWVEQYNHTPSRANGLDGLAPLAAYREFQPPAEERARRQVTEIDLALAFAEHYPDRLILPGGIIELPDGKRGVVRYDSPLLWDLSNQRREVVRSRGDHSAVLVLPSRKGEEIIVAKKRLRVGTRDALALGNASETLARMRKLAAAIMPRLDAQEKLREAAELVADLPVTMTEVSGEDDPAPTPSPAAGAKVSVEELRPARAPESSLHDLEPVRAEEL